MQSATSGQDFDYDERAMELKLPTLEEIELRNAETEAIRAKAMAASPPKASGYDPSQHKPREPLRFKRLYVNDSDPIIEPPPRRTGIERLSTIQLGRTNPNRPPLPANATWLPAPTAYLN